MVPGLGSDEDLYAEQRAALGADVDVRITSVRDGASIGDMAQAALAVAPERFALLGLSMGGYVALEVVRRAPERVTALALLDTSARPESAGQSARRAELAAVVAERGFPAMLDELWPHEVAASRVGDAALRQRFDAMMTRAGPEVFLRQQQAVTRRADSRPLLAQVVVPALVPCGREDRITPRDGSEELAAGLADARLVVLDDCGHLSSWERPDAVTAAVREWLAR
jgi:pimeloyl-ACP methyl ester carboxylesterase